MTPRAFFNNKFAGVGMARMKARRASQGQPTKGMNKLEARYAAHLSWCSNVVSWKYEAMSLWLAEGLRYIPDFAVEYEGGEIHLVDVKALWGNGKVGIEDDSLAKLKMVGQEYGNWFKVKAVWFDKKLNSWEERTFDHQEREGT